MKRKLIIAAAILNMAFSADAYLSYVKADFSNGEMPAGFTLHDIDGLAANNDQSYLGFSGSGSWTVGRFFNEDNWCIASTSYFTSPGTASDWIVTPLFSVDSGKAELRWTARASNSKLADGYSVYVSTKGPRPEDFDESGLLFRVDHEKDSWTRHRVSLSEYNGKDVWVAFVNDSHDCDYICLDDIFAGVPASAYILCDTPDVIGNFNPIDLNASVYTDEETPVHGFSVGMEIEGITTWKDYPDAVLNPGELFPVMFESALNPDSEQTIFYTLKVKHGDDLYELPSSLTVLQNRVVCEEITGTWCGFCVSGIVALEDMRRDFSDTFIAIAVHMGDIMTVERYSSQMGAFIESGLPAMTMNHDLATSGHPKKIRDFYNSLIKRKPEASVRVKPVYDPTTRMITAESTLRMASDCSGDDYIMKYVVIENDVHHPGDREYYQTNAYAGGENGEMAGWELKPEKIPSDEMYYQEVARFIKEDCEALPDRIEKLSEIIHIAMFELPDNVDYSGNVEVVAMLTDTKGKVVNAAKAPLEIPGAVSQLRVVAPRVIISNDGWIRIESDETLLSTLYSIDGTAVATGSNVIYAGDRRGIYILKIKSTDEIHTVRVLIQ